MLKGGHELHVLLHVISYHTCNGEYYRLPLLEGFARTIMTSNE